MIKKDVNPSELARILGVSLVAVYRVRKGNLPSRRIREAIAESIKKPVEQVFPPHKKAA
jgi:DNA-binding XRE family transcriptional regulator